MLLFVAAITSMSFAACSDDDDDNLASGDAAKLVGIWECDNEDGWALQLDKNYTGIDYEWGYNDINSTKFTWQYTPENKTITIRYANSDPSDLQIWKVISVTDRELRLLDQTDDDGMFIFTKRQSLPFSED